MLPSACPHYDGEAERRPTYCRLIGKKILPAGIAADNGAAIHYIDRIYRCVSSKPNARAYRVEVKGGKVTETALPTLLLEPAAG